MDKCKRQNLANLLFAGGGLTAAALLTQYQLGGEPQSVSEWQPTTATVTEALNIETPELPKVQTPYFCRTPRPVSRTRPVEPPAFVGGATMPTHTRIDTRVQQLDNVTFTQGEVGLPLTE